ncbi:MAG: DUF3347 domain-containing protein [Chitinophagaceae bacterium]|nr:DUF3347 domain-containing protein [Chitinophagaceae bacterium]
MKNILLAVALLFSYQLFAQNPSDILTAYYGVKDALTADDANAASVKAGELLTAIDKVDMSKLNEKEHKAFMGLKDKLTFDARHISEKKEVAHQREHFVNLSVNMLALAKAVKLSTQPIYEEFCPMKKASWLSNDPAIKNPYYGNAMLTCGKVQTTLKP